MRTKGLLLVAVLGLGWLLGWLGSWNDSVTAEPLIIEPLEKPQPPPPLLGWRGVSIWTRTAGQYADGKEVPKTREMRVLWKKIKLETRKMFDVQYHGNRTYKGVWVHTLLRQYRKPRYVNLALLHFRNGMVVPYPLKTVPGRDPMPVFVAVKMKETKGWTRHFPMVMRTPALPIYKDNRPVWFRGNKVVVQKGDHPHVLDHVAGNIQIWKRVNTLTGIELVNEDAYYKQFAGPNKPTVRKGWLMYRGACQFCHGAHRMGATYGNDFVKPLAMFYFAYNVDELHYHVTFKSADAMHRGKAMPAIKEMPKVQVGYLWQWMKGVVRHSVPAYQPYKVKKPTTRPNRRAIPPRRKPVPARPAK